MIKWNTDRRAVDNKVRGYNSVELLDGRAIKICKSEGSWAVKHPSIESHQLDNHTVWFNKLAQAKAFSETLIVKVGA